MVAKLEKGKRYHLDIDGYENAAYLAAQFPDRVRKTNCIVTYYGEYNFFFDKEYHDTRLARWSTYFHTYDLKEISQYLTPVNEEISDIDIYIDLFVGEYHE
jgi:hypothetical protein